jgi:hypothetical protein
MRMTATARAAIVQAAKTSRPKASPEVAGHRQLPVEVGEGALDDEEPHGEAEQQPGHLARDRGDGAPHACGGLPACCGARPTSPTRTATSNSHHTARPTNGAAKAGNPDNERPARQRTRKLSSLRPLQTADIDYTR